MVGRTVRLIALLALAGTAEASAASLYVDVTDTHLPAQDFAKHSMNALATDLDGDGDLDIAIAIEYGINLAYFNDGRGCFANLSSERLSPIFGDHEDVTSADYDRDGDTDLVFVGEDDQVYGYHLNDGKGVFIDVTKRLPSRGTSNAVETGDFDGDGDADLYVGNNGQDFVFINDGRGFFADETAARLPASDDITQHVAVGDVDADGDLDVLLGNEGGNRLLVNDGTGVFTERPLPKRAAPEESRDADLVDIDGDGDLDIYFSNVTLFVRGADPQSRLLLNDGTGTFTDTTGKAPLADGRSTYASGFLDFDGDGDLDLITGTMGDRTGRTADSPWLSYTNDGRGTFKPTDALPATATGNGFDVAIGDYNGDGLQDLFLASRGGPDRLLLHTSAELPVQCPVDWLSVAQFWFQRRIDSLRRAILEIWATTARSFGFIG